MSEAHASVVIGVLIKIGWADAAVRGNHLERLAELYERDAVSFSQLSRLWERPSGSSERWKSTMAILSCCYEVLFYPSM